MKNQARCMKKTQFHGNNNTQRAGKDLQNLSSKEVY